MSLTLWNDFFLDKIIIILYNHLRFMETRYINSHNWHNFLLNQVEAYDIFSLFNQGDADYIYSKLSTENLKNTTVGKYRSLSPVKSFFFSPSEKLVPPVSKKPQIIVGVKACELAHLRLLDEMFLGGEPSPFREDLEKELGKYKDPIYEEARKNTIIISADCTSAKDTCFCSKIEGQPYPTYGFDINLRPIKNGFVVELLSEKGKKLIENSDSLFQNAVQEHLDESEKSRYEVKELILKANKDFNPAFTFNKTDLWKDVSKECVECGGCRFVCSTCYCFLLGELPNFEKFRLWDACQFKGYARVAGGASSRSTKEKRYKNLYSCKFDYRKQNFGFYACSGCGRCIEVCPAEIDIRKVLTRIHANNSR
ncbi:MAG: 4Fe-4S dicluster domain-containing protein [Elusimicrobiota bacterium]